MNIMKLNIAKHLTSILLLLLTLSFSLNAIEFISGSGADVSNGTGSDRFRDFFYHNNTDDQHWYNTGVTPHKWAVRFDFASEYETYHSSSFVITKVKVYFPVLPDSIHFANLKVSVNSKLNVNDSLSTATVTDTTSNWAEFTLYNPVTVDTAWVVVTCNTTQTGPYISASLGGGTHSYYWNTNAPTPYYQNLFLAGYNSEFLFSVVGRFVLGDVDLELSAFELGPQVAMNTIASPSFTIYNNSDSLVTNASVVVNITSPHPTFAVQDTIFINRVIQPNSELVVDYGDPDFQDYRYRLPDYPLEFRVNSVLHSEYDLADTLFNNTIIKYYSSFSESLPVHLVENFYRFDQTQNILAVQDLISDNAVKTISYFPVVADTFNVPGVAQRYNWYGFFGLPVTVVGGDYGIVGYIPVQYANLYSDAINGINLQRTFIRQNSATISLPQPYGIMQVKTVLRNPDTYVFDNGIDPSIFMQSRFYAALCKKVNLYAYDRLIFDRWGAYADTIGTALGLGSTWLKDFNINVNNIGSDSLLTDYDLVYWIQHKTSKQIIYANVIPLDEVESLEDQTVPEIPFSLRLAPNPIRINSELKLLLPQSITKSSVTYKIYNCKGQLIRKGRIDYTKDNNVIPITDIKSSGLYIIRVETSDKTKPGKINTATKKIIVF